LTTFVLFTAQPDKNSVNNPTVRSVTFFFKKYPFNFNEKNYI